MDTKDKGTLSEQAAKLVLLLLGLHFLLFFDSMVELRSRTWLRLGLLTLYALCLLRLDLAFWRQNSPRVARTMSRYWLIASLCAGAWQIWGEGWLSSSNDVLPLLISFAVLPYGHIFSRNYQGWLWQNTRLCADLGGIGVLLLCLAHLVLYTWLSRRRSEE